MNIMGKTYQLSNWIFFFFVGRMTYNMAATQNL